MRTGSRASRSLLVQRPAEAGQQGVINKRGLPYPASWKTSLAQSRCECIPGSKQLITDPRISKRRNGTFRERLRPPGDGRSPSHVCPVGALRIMMGHSLDSRTKGITCDLWTVMVTYLDT